jgi:SAM-dependent methyltransferase
MSPLCESYVDPQNLDKPEAFYPLHVQVCEHCFLVQLPECVSPEHIYSEYAYFSSYSDSWIEHMRRYADGVTDRFGLDPNSLVMEIASNDGYLLQHFLQRGIPCLGIEPAANVAKTAIERGIPTSIQFFGQEVARDLAREAGRPDLLIGNNVLAHVPDLNDFVSGMKILLKPGGVITMEFPHLLRLIEENQFDTIYHEHYSYLSLYATEQVFGRHDLTLFDVEELPTHGGSLRIYAQHADDERRSTERLDRLRAQEAAFGVATLNAYSGFQQRVIEAKHKLLEFLIDAKRHGKRIAGYGAPGKGNTLLNYCGIRTDFLDYTVDRNPYKQGLYTPGARIPILQPEKILETRPDYLLILPWNLAEEISQQMAMISEWGGRFVVPIPEVRVL